MVTVLLAGLVAAGALVTGCAGGAPSAGDAFTLDVVPEAVQGESIAGQEVVFLVTLAGGGDATPVTVSARATGGSARVEEPELGQGADVAEVVVVPDPAAVGGRVDVTIRGERGQASAEVGRSFGVVDGEDDRAPDAAALRDRFVGWLAENRPDLAISPDTAWTGTIVSPQWLGVSHYLFFSPEWEMHVSWLIMVPPNDWARADLRRRFIETAPSEAFEIASVSGQVTPAPTEVPDAVWR